MKHSTTIKNKIKTNKYLLSLAGLFILAFTAGFLLTQVNPNNTFPVTKNSFISNEDVTTSPTPTVAPMPISKTLSNNDYHIFQTYNNCGPAALSMALSFYDINVSQDELGQELRPYQSSIGDNDDKSVTLEELAEKSKEYGLTPYHRPMGNPEIVKKFIANDIPVITRTWTKPNEDIGHFRIIKGYDDENKTFLQDDSLQDKNLIYTYDEFDEIWKKFNYEYLVLVPNEKEKIIKEILGENLDKKTAWKNAVENSVDELEENPDDIYARFNLSVAYHNTEEHEKSINEFEKVEYQLPFRTLWYQIEPIESYFELGKYDRVFEITDRILNNQNRAFSELYILRGKVFETQGDTEAAETEYQNAIFYNSNLKATKEMILNLNEIGSSI